MAAVGMRLGSAAANGYRGWVRLRDFAFTRATRSAFAEFGPRAVLQMPVWLEGPSRISIGSNVFVGAGSWLHALEDRSVIEIGEGCSMSGPCTLSAMESIRIGRKVLMGRNVHIADHGHDFSDLTLAVMEQGVRDVRPVDIGDGAWLGHCVLVGPGVRIGRGAVIGANSVVLNDVPDFGVAVGAPARITRRRDSAAEFALTEDFKAHSVGEIEPDSAGTQRQSR